MTGPKRRVEAAEREAADWHRRLGEPSVSAQTIHDFFEWRQTPLNADAYQRVKTVWTETGKLRGDADLQRAAAEALNRKTPRMRPSWTALAGGALAAVVVVAIGVNHMLERRTVYSTQVGEERVIQLADGSAVRLDTASRVKIRFSDGRRGVDLQQGQALFTVVRDPDRPFVVSAGGSEVTALGTVFGVRVNGQGVNVVLVEGAVDVAAPDRSRTRMAAGERVDVRASHPSKRQADVVAETGWTEGRLVFRGEALDAAVAEVNRYLTRKIVVEPGAAGGDTVNGVFRTGDRDAFVSTASAVFGLEAVLQTDGTIVLKDRTQ